ARGGTGVEGPPDAGPLQNSRRLHEQAEVLRSEVPLRSAMNSQLAVGVVLALSAGIIDVCVALLNKPRGFETLTALPPSILATAGVVLAVYLVLWSVVRPAAARIGLELGSVASSFATFLGSVF